MMVEKQDCRVFVFVADLLIEDYLRDQYIECMCIQSEDFCTPACPDVMHQGAIQGGGANDHPQTVARYVQR